MRRPFAFQNSGVAEWAMLRFPEGKKSEEIWVVQTRGACGNRSVISRFHGSEELQGARRRCCKARSFEVLKCRASGHISRSYGGVPGKRN
jgi:hypothetical protein